MEKNITFAQLEHLHSKYTGTGDSNTTKLEWISGIHRDTYASILSHSNLQLYMSAAEDGESLARIKYNLMNVRIELDWIECYDTNLCRQ